MLKHILFLNVFAAASIFLGSCSEFYQQAQTEEATAAAAAQQTAKPHVITVSETDNGREIALRRNDILVVKLKAQFGTGYSWHLIENDRGRFELIEQHVEQPNDGGNGNVDLSSETQVFRFKAKPPPPGEFGFELHYIRVWEKDVPPLKKFQLKIRIEQ